jgi:integrase
MREKRLRSGDIAYFWEPPSIYVGQGFHGRAEALGSNYAGASERARLLTAFLDDWRCGRGPLPAEEARRGFGTVAWLFDRYLRSPAFEQRVHARSRYEYRRALKRVEDVSTTTGGSVGGLPVASITAGAVDKIYAKLRIGPRGARVRQANLSVDIARRAWDVVRRLAPAAVPSENPWRGVLRVTTKRSKPAATRDEVYALAQALIQIGEPHLGAAALICFEWHQRPEHVRNGDITWADYRPPQRPDAVHIRHPKTGEKGWVPLVDEEGQLFPEMEAYLAQLPRLGLPIVLTQGRRGPARPYSNEYAQRKVREARMKAGLGPHVTLDACRHGGLTELGDAGATEFEGMAASMHRTPQALRLYVKRSERQRMSAARKRRRMIERAGKS